MPSTIDVKGLSDVDFIFDWRALTHGQEEAQGDWLQPGENIASSVVAVAPAGVEIHDVSEDDGQVTFWARILQGPKDYYVSNAIVTDSTPPRSWTEVLVIQVR